MTDDKLADALSPQVKKETLSETEHYILTSSDMTQNVCTKTHTRSNTKTASNTTVTGQT